MSSVGELLRCERMRRGLDLDQISHELKIAPRFLEAIEDDRFDRLPGAVFAKSFVRQYARLLDLDEDELAAEVQRRFEPPPATPATAPDIPPITESRPRKRQDWRLISDRRPTELSSSLAALALLVVVMLVCSGVYSFWHRSRRPVIASQASPPVESTQPPALDSAPRTEPAPESQPAAPQPAPEQPAPTAQQPGAVAANPTTESSKPSQGEASRSLTPGHPVNVEVTAEEPVWVLARTDGKYAFSGTLEPNETKSVEGGEVVLRLGNAGGVSIKLNGKEIGPIGPRGQVREVQLTSGGFHIVAVPKPSLPLDNPI